MKENCVKTGFVLTCGVSEANLSSVMSVAAREAKQVQTATHSSVVALLIVTCERCPAPSKIK